MHELACRGELFKAIVRREVSFFDSAEVGVLTSRLGSDCQAVVRCLSTNINVAARNSMQCIGGQQRHQVWVHCMHLSLADSDCALLCCLLFPRPLQRAMHDKAAGGFSLDGLGGWPDAAVVPGSVAGRSMKPSPCTGLEALKVRWHTRRGGHLPGLPVQGPGAGVPGHDGAAVGGGPPLWGLLPCVQSGLHGRAGQHQPGMRTVLAAQTQPVAAAACLRVFLTDCFSG